MSTTLRKFGSSCFRGLRLDSGALMAGLVLLATLGCSSTSGSDAPVGGNGGSEASSGAGNGGRGGVSPGGCAPTDDCSGPLGGSGGAGQGSGGTAGGGGSGGRNEAGTEAMGGAVSEPGVHYVGRVDTSVEGEARFAWSGTGAVVRFEGTSASVELQGGQEFTVVVDGTVQPKLQATEGMNLLATGLSAGEHTVELYRRTEAAQGESTILGFDFGGGKLLAPPPVTRRLEFIGDSITCGYGNEGANASCSFTPQTENHYLSYAALTARELKAELSTVAWSGKGVVCNYGDDASSCTDPLPSYYDRTLPSRADSVWSFSRFQPDAVVINLGTNDLSTSMDPDESTFENAYKALLGRVREAYPSAHILCTNGPMLGGTDLANARRYIQEAVTDLADPNITVFELATQDGSDGFGCDSHPSLERHKKMATVVTAAIRAALDW